MQFFAVENFHGFCGFASNCERFTANFWLENCWPFTAGCVPLTDDCVVARILGMDEKNCSKEFPSYPVEDPLNIVVSLKLGSK